MKSKKFNLKNYIELPKSKTLPLIIFIFCVILLNTIFVVRLYNKQNEKKDIVRLHVVANSNNTQDQLTKLKIASKVEEYISSLNLKENNTKDILQNIANHKNEILTIANKTLQEDNMEYAAQLNIGKIQYDEKQSTTLDMEQGIYDSVQIVLGNGDGKNFWSLIFPNKENIEKIKGYETILPGISNIYEEEPPDEEQEDKVYTFKGLEILDNIAKMLNKSHR